MNEKEWFGEPPRYLMGWAGIDVANVAFEEMEEDFISYEEYREWTPDDVDEVPSVRIWDEIKEDRNVNGGKHLPTFYQKTGDCVSMGCATAVNYRAGFEIAVVRQEEVWHQAFQPWIYGVSRMAPDLGNGRLGRGAGSTGAWGAGALNKYGNLFADDPGVPEYSGSLADQWGRHGPPDEFYVIAEDNKVLKVPRLDSVDQIRHELINRRPVTIASNRGFKMTPKTEAGYHVFVPSGSWSHQMVLLDWTDDNGGMAYRMNSWGENAHGDPLNGEPPGGAWNRSGDLESELRRYGVELYACSLFEGTPSEPDGGIL